jgi:succinate dehydrogenase / fumarate reductase membrane anchor subunit
MKYKHKWIIQKISAITFAITLILTIINFKEIDIFDHSSVVVFFESKLNSLIILILVGSILIHSNIGVSSIIDDYIHNQNSKTTILVFKNFLLAVLFIITILTLVYLVI